MDVCVKVGDSTLNSGPIIRLVAGRTCIRTSVQYLIAFCSRPDEASDVISGSFVMLTVPTIVYKPLSEIRAKAIGGGILDSFSNFDKCRSEVAGDVISSVAIEYVGMDIHVKFCDSRLNNGQTIRLFGQLD